MPTEAPAAPVEQASATPEIVIQTPEVTPEKPSPMWAVKVGEKPAEEKKPEVTPEKVETPKAETPKPTKEESFATLRKKSEDLQKELDDLRGKYSTVEKEYNDYKSKPIELPEEHKTRLTKAEQERDEYLKEIRAFRIEKDPEFTERYVKPIQNSIAIMQRVATEAGVDEATLKAGFGRWDDNAFGEWMENMQPGQKAKFSAAWMEAERLEQERVGKIADSNKTYEEMIKTREAEAKSRFEADQAENQKLAKGLIKKFILDNESTKDFEDLPQAAENIAMRVARYEITPQEVMETAIQNQALVRMHNRQVESNKSLTEKIAELEKKIADQDSFIKEHAGATPNPAASGVIPKDGAKPQAMWDVRIA